MRTAVSIPKPDSSLAIPDIVPQHIDLEQKQRFQTYKKNVLATGKKMFLPYYFNRTDSELRNLSNADQERILSHPQDAANILIRFSDVWGNQLLENPSTTSQSQYTENYGETNGKKWSVPVVRLRINQRNRYLQSDGKLSPKYRSPKGSKVHIFLNGIFAYFVEPLLKQGLSRAEIIERLQPVFKKIVITEGEFKAFVGCKNGIPTIGITGIHNAVKTIKQTFEKGTLNESSRTVGAILLKELSDFLLMFDVEEIEFLHDSDAFDNLNNHSRATSFSASPRNLFFAICKFNQEHGKRIKLNYCFIDSPATNKLGLDDLIEAYPTELSLIKRELFAPENGIKKFIRKIPITCKDDYETLRITFLKSADTRPTFNNTILISTRATKKRKRRLSKLLQKRGVDISNKYLIAPTGSGKNWTVAKTEGKKTVACPQTVLVRNIGKEYNAAQYRGNQKDFDNLPTADQIVTTYNSLPNIPQQIHSGLKIVNIPRSDRHLFVDEAHNFSTATSRGFRHGAMNNVFNLIDDFRAVTLMTGTPVYNRVDKINKLDKVILKVSKTTKTFNYIESDDTLNAAANAAKKAISCAKFPIILMDEKSMDRRLGTLQALIDNPNVKALNSDTKEEFIFKEFLEKGTIPATIKGLITTTVLKEGNNIYNRFDYIFIIIGNFHHSDIEQLTNRPRHPENVHITFIKSDKREKSDQGFIPAVYGYHLEQQANKIIDELNTPSQCDEQSLLMEFQSANYIQSYPIKKVGDKYELDELNLNHHVIRAQTTAENRNDRLMIKALAKYNIIYVEHQVDEDKRSSNADSRTSVSRAAAKLKKLEKYQAELASLKDMTSIVDYCSDGLKYAKRLPPERRKIYQRVVKLSQHTDNPTTILNLLQAKDKDGNDKVLSDAKFNELLARINIYQLRNNDKYMNENRKFGILIRSFQDAFKIGDVLDSKTIKERVKDCLGLVGNFNLTPYDEDSRNDKALKVIRMFFDVQRVTVRKGKDVNQLYKICNLTFDNILNNQQKLGYKTEEELLKTTVSRY